jgi:hypothetical protein
MYTVRVADNYHYMDESETYTSGTYPTIEEAIVKCKDIVDQFLSDNYSDGMSSDSLYGTYVSFGDDPYIIGGQEFSAWDYAKKRCAEICVK